VHTTEESKPPIPPINEDRMRQKLTPPSDQGEEDTKEDLSQPRSKRAKEELIPNSKLKENSASSKSATVKSERMTKSDVFSRLTTKKSLSSMGKKAEKKNYNLNFFDNQYKQAIKGKDEIFAIFL